MVKKLTLALLALLWPVFALAESVYDECGLFTAGEIQQMEEAVDEIREDYGMDVLVLTSERARLNRSLDFADNFYDESGAGEDGMVYFIDMRNRVPAISTSGEMIDLITDRRLEKLLDAGYDDLSRGRYGEAVLTTLRQLKTYLRQGREEGSYRYDAVTGERLTGRYNRLTSLEALVAAAAGLIAAGAFIASVAGRYQMKGGVNHYNLADNASRTLTRDDERFLHQTVMRHRNDPPPSSHGGNGGSGSGVHTSSGGQTHGGGSGRHF